MNTARVFRVIIAGGRDYTDHVTLTERCDELLVAKIDDGYIIEVVSGAAAGADTLGELYGEKRDYFIKRMPANWSRYGKSAGYKRNVEMAEYADALIAFWNGNTQRSGTNHMINIAKDRELPTRIVRY